MEVCETFYELPAGTRNFDEKQAIAKAGGSFERAVTSSDNAEEISGHRLLVIKKTK